MTEPTNAPSNKGGAAETGIRAELLEASDATIEEATEFADAMVLRGLLYQLTGDPQIQATTPYESTGTGLFPSMQLGDEDEALVRRKAAEFLKSYRDSGASRLGSGPADRLPKSITLTTGE